MEPIWQWGLDLIRTVQLVHGPVLDGLFKAITFLGEEDFFMILLPLVLWCVDFASGMRLAVVFLTSTYVNDGLKAVFAHPRPFELDPSVKLYDAEGYGLPSGHSQSAVIVWGTLAAELRKRWLWIVAVVLMVLIGFSRIYLGVHFPTDVLGGWAVGVGFLMLYLAVGPRLEAWLVQSKVTIQLLLAVLLPIALLLIYASDTATTVMGVLIGAGVGAILTEQSLHFSADGPLWQRVARLVVGSVVIVGLRYGLKLIFPDEGEPLYFLMRTVRYGVMGLWAGLGAPWLFLRLRLASRKGD
jgi:membrane-associated phospholipid phosphatase